MNVFGSDQAADFAGYFAGDLYSATITRRQPGEFDPNDPSSGPATIDTVYTGDAITFVYDEDLIAGEQVKNTNFLVTIMLGSIRRASTNAIARYVPQPGDTISVPPPSASSPVDAIVSSIKSLTEVAVTCVVGGQLSDG